MGASRSGGLQWDQGARVHGCCRRGVSLRVAFRAAAPFLLRRLALLNALLWGWRGSLRGSVGSAGGGQRRRREICC